jgi:hypothetical protein
MSKVSLCLNISEVEKIESAQNLLREFAAADGQPNPVYNGHGIAVVADVAESDIPALALKAAEAHFILAR